MCLSVQEASAAAGIGRDGLYEAIREGRLTAIKFGRRTLIRREDLEAFIRGLNTLQLRPREPAQFSRSVQ